MKETIIQQLNLKAQEYETALAEFEQIQTLLTACDGKTIKYLKNRLPEGMSIDKPRDETGITISVTGNFHPISDNNTINVKELKGLDSTHYAEAKRHLADIKNLQEDPEKIAALERIYTTMKESYSALKTACKELNTTDFESYYNPIWQPMLDIIGVPSSLVMSLQDGQYK